MAKVFKAGWAAVLITVFATAVLYAEVTDRIVAVVNDEVITLAELNRAFEPYAMNIEKNYKGPNPEEVLKQNRAALLQRMIDQMLIEQEAKKAGGPLATVTEEEILSVLQNTLAKNNLTMDTYLRKLAEEGGSLESVKKEIKGQILRMRLLRREVQSKVLVPDEAIGEYYNRHRQDYEGKEAVHLRQILLTAPATLDPAAREAVRQQARQLYERIAKGEPFDRLAAQYSKGPEAASGGDIGFVERGVIVPEVEKAAFSLPVGKVSDVIESELGFHIIAVVDKRGAGLKPLAVVRNEIKAKIEEEMVMKKFDEWIDGIRKKSFIDVRL